MLVWVINKELLLFWLGSEQLLRSSLTHDLCGVGYTPRPSAACEFNFMEKLLSFLLL